MFGASRFLWPIQNLLLLALIGVYYGAGAVADYTYSLTIAAPLYFLTAFAFSLFLLVDGKKGKYPRESLFLRVSTVAASVPLAALAAALLPSPLAHTTFAVWILKLGDILFEPVPVHIGRDASIQHRGRKLLFCDASRVLLSQALIWYCLLVLKEGLFFLLVVTGLGNLALSILFLVSIPKWTSHPFRMHRVLAVWRRMFRLCLPMTLSGVLLALLVGLPRLLVDGMLEEHERALFGTAQVIGSGLAVLFNAMWLYEVHHLEKRIQARDVSGATRINLRLSLFFLAALSVGSMLLFPVEPLIISIFGIKAEPSLLLPALVFLLAIQHCISVHRDLLKLMGKVWTEVAVLVAAIVAATLANEAVLALGASWQLSISVLCVTSALVQVLLSYVQVHRPSVANANKDKRWTA